jgi:hypothetical protein
VGELFCDALQAGACWTLDSIGYNFRHEIELPPKSFDKFQLRYEIMTTLGARATLRFDVRHVPHDRH